MNRRRQKTNVVREFFAYAFYAAQQIAFKPHESDFVALVGERFGNARADAACSACDDGNLHKPSTIFAMMLRWISLEPA